MFATIIAIAAVFTVVVVAHSYVLEEIHKDALSDAPRTFVDSLPQLQYEKPSHPD